MWPRDLAAGFFAGAGCALGWMRDPALVGLGGGAAPAALCFIIGAVAGAALSHGVGRLAQIEAEETRRRPYWVRAGRAGRMLGIVGGAALLSWTLLLLMLGLASSFSAGG